jgi:hypothetical protein
MEKQTKIDLLKERLKSIGQHKGSGILYVMAVIAALREIGLEPERFNEEIQKTKPSVRLAE